MLPLLELIPRPHFQLQFNSKADYLPGIDLQMHEIHQAILYSCKRPRTAR